MYGLDYLGGAKYKQLILAEHPNGWGAGFFSNISGFGDALPVIDALLATGRCPLVRIHTMWKDDHNYKESDIAVSIKEAKRFAVLKQKYPQVEFRISLFCEHNLKRPVLEKAHIAFDEALPWAAYVNTPLEGKGDYLPGVINEFHGASKKPTVGGRIQFSFDGTSCVDSDVEAYKNNYSSAEIFFFWEPRFNGRWEDNDKTPRPQRKGYPDNNLIDSVIYLHQSKGATVLPAKWLYKSHSENKGNGDPRAEKPVLIIPIKAKEVLLKAQNGQVIDTLSYYGTFDGGLYRYYSKNWGYQTADKAKRIQGSPIVKIEVNGKEYGVINPAFRNGSFR